MGAAKTWLLVKYYASSLAVIHVLKCWPWLVESRMTGLLQSWHRQLSSLVWPQDMDSIIVSRPWTDSGVEWLPFA